MLPIVPFQLPCGAVIQLGVAGVRGGAAGDRIPREVQNRTLF